ncbi:MAG: ribosome rescue protein RqcH, partial [Thermoplasmata archaeon]
DGNLILTDGPKITFAIKQRRWKNRSLEIGQDYIPPSLINPIEYSDEEAKEVLLSSSASIVQTLATRFNLGGDLSEEILFRSGINKNTRSVDAVASYEKIHQKIHEILDESTKNRSYYYENDKNLSPVAMHHLGSPDREFDDLNSGFVFQFGNIEKSEEKEDSITRRINSQKRSIEEFKKISEKYREYGTAIMSNLPYVSGIIKDIKSGKIPDGVSIDKATKKAVINIEDKELEISYIKTAGDNANDFFNESKEYKKKIEGAIKAIADAEKERSRDRVKKEVQRKKIFWFESYHWFISSHGYLVIAGRDAKSNEKIVKKHLKEGDVYVHADVYGAPSTIIKSEGKPFPDELTLREACIFAASFSRAWAAGIASSTVYWVYPSQVSKTPESGEYVSTGSWIIRGKRNYITDLELRLGICMIEIEKTNIPMIAPYTVLKENQKYVVITPGETRRIEAVKKIAEFLSTNKNEIEKILPPGNSSVLETHVPPAENEKEEDEKESF